MERKYWLDLFTGKTWSEFLKAGGKVSGFRERRRKTAEKIKPGDYFICYLTGLSRIIGILEVKSEIYMDHTPIWEDTSFPCRFKTNILFKLEPETAIPIKEFENKLSIFKNLRTPHSWTGFFRGSPALFKNKEDGEIIVEMVKETLRNPIRREYDERKYWRSPRIFDSSIGVVTVPESKDDSDEIGSQPIVGADPEEAKTTHEEIQWRLLKLGSDMGLDVWVARNDRNKSYNGNNFSDIPRLLRSLPRQFDEATNRTIELIDVLWLQNDAIIAAFEVEHTSAIYSGLLRMSDLVSMQPNIKINLYIVASDERSEKVFNEINRPTFARLKPPLPKICKFISYSRLKSNIEDVGDKMYFMKPEFIDYIAESCEPDEA